MNFRSSHAILSIGALLDRIGRGLFRSGVTVRQTYELKVNLDCDEDTGRWYVAESDIPGLWLEADDPASLIEKIKQVAPELIELNQEEIIRNCQGDDVDWRTLRPSVRPVFDSPFALAIA